MKYLLLFCFLLIVCNSCETMNVTTNEVTRLEQPIQSRGEVQPEEEEGELTGVEEVQVVTIDESL